MITRPSAFALSRAPPASSGAALQSVSPRGAIIKHGAPEKPIFKVGKIGRGQTVSRLRP